MGRHKDPLPSLRRWGRNPASLSLRDAFLCARHGATYFARLLPAARRDFEVWSAAADAIADPELRGLARRDHAEKRFNAQGALLAAACAPPAARIAVARFAVAYQVLADYLDLMEEEGLTRAELMLDALCAAVDLTRDCDVARGRADDEYVGGLVAACRGALARLPSYAVVRTHLTSSAAQYARGQELVHEAGGTAVHKLRRWAERTGREHPALHWWELVAATGSTLPVYALAALAATPALEDQEAQGLVAAYFPWACAVHILLDSLVDRERDVAAGHLSYMSYYRSLDEAHYRIDWLLRRALAAAERGGEFHSLLVRGMVGLYLADPAFRRAEHAELRAALRRAVGIPGLASELYFALRPRMGRALKPILSWARGRADDLRAQPALDSGVVSCSRSMGRHADDRRTVFSPE